MRPHQEFRAAAAAHKERGLFSPWSRTRRRPLLDSGGATSQGIGDVDRHLDSSVEEYNKAVASLEGRLLPATRRLREMSSSEKELPELEPVDHTPRLPLEG